MEGKICWRVCVLGKLTLLRDCTAMQLPQSKKTRALLAYLAVTARPHSRNRLCAMFWSVPDDPRAALRWSLTRLRTLVDGPDRRVITADRENVALDLDGVAVDILSLRNAARTGTDAMSTDALREAAEALDGDFLEGLDLPDCQEFTAGARRNARRRGGFRAQILGALVAVSRTRPTRPCAMRARSAYSSPPMRRLKAALVRLLRATGRWREAEEQYQRAQQRPRRVQRGAHRNSAPGGAAAVARRRAYARRWRRSRTAQRGATRARPLRCTRCGFAGPRTMFGSPMRVSARARLWCGRALAQSSRV